MRNRRLFRLTELNQVIAVLLVDLNQHAFEQLGAQALHPLPTERFELFPGRHSTMPDHLRASPRARLGLTTQELINGCLPIDVRKSTIVT